ADRGRGAVRAELTQCTGSGLRLRPDAYAARDDGPARRRVPPCRDQPVEPADARPAPSPSRGRGGGRDHRASVRLGHGLQRLRARPRLHPAAQGWGTVLPARDSWVFRRHGHAGARTRIHTRPPTRARRGPQDLVAPVRAAMQQTAANLPYAAVTPLADLVAPSIRPWRLGTTMFGLFAGLALVLAAVGLYSVLSYTVGQRSHEIGIRMAMGARRGNVLGLMVGQGVKIAALGAGIGAVV